MAGAGSNSVRSERRADVRPPVGPLTRPRRKRRHGACAPRVLAGNSSLQTYPRERIICTFRIAATIESGGEAARPIPITSSSSRAPLRRSVQVQRPPCSSAAPSSVTAQPGSIAITSDSALSVASTTDGPTSCVLSTISLNALSEAIARSMSTAGARSMRSSSALASSLFIAAPSSMACACLRRAPCAKVARDELTEINAPVAPRPTTEAQARGGEGR